jgi:hypothetical protein
MLSYFSQYSPQGLMPQFIPGLQGAAWPQVSPGLLGQPGIHGGYGPHTYAGASQVIPLLGQLAQQIAVQGSVAQQQGVIAQQIGIALYQLSQHLAHSMQVHPAGLDAGYGQGVHAFGGFSGTPLFGGVSGQPFGLQSYGAQPFVQQPFVQQPFVQPFVQQPFPQGPFAASQTGGWAANRGPTIN